MICLETSASESAETERAGALVEHDLRDQLPDHEPVQAHRPGLVRADRAAELTRKLLQPVVVQGAELPRS